MRIEPGIPLGQANVTAAQNAYANKADSDFHKLVRQARAEQDDLKLRQTCREMEAIFVHKMLQVMRTSIPEGGLIPESTASKIYRDMLDEAYSKIIAESRDNLGIGDMLYRQLKQQDGAGTGEHDNGEEG